jgi:hypothetical protein
MKKTLLSLLLAGTTALLLSSCAAVTEKLATKENIEKLPEPFKSLVIQLKKDQEAIAARYTQGTKTMLKAYSTIAEAVGMKTQAATLRAEADALNAGSSLSDARKAMNRSASIIKAVRDKVASSKGVTAASKEKFTQGVQIKNQAYLVQVTLTTDASLKAANAVKAAKGASPMQMAILTTQLDPLYFIIRDVPKFLAEERKFNDICKEYAKEQKISIPTAPLPTPKLSNMNF